MDGTELDIGGAVEAPRARSRKAALEALERLLRAHAALSAERDPEGPYGRLRPAREEEIAAIEAVFLHCGVPLPDTLRAIYRRTLGVGNPVSALPVLAVPFLRAALPDEGFGCPVVGLEAFEKDLGVHRDEAALERPPFLHLGHAAPAGLTVSRNGLWSLGDYMGRREPPPAEDFHLVFEAGFVGFVDQVLLLWANDLAGAVVRPRDLDLGRGARLEAMPTAVREALAHLVAPRTLGPKGWGEVQALEQPDLLRVTRRGEEGSLAAAFGPGIAVVGLPYGDYPRVAGGIGPETLLRLRPVDDNPHDAQAVEVWHDGDIPARVGFVERRSAPDIRALPEGPAAWRLRVVGLSDHALYGVLERGGPKDDRASAREEPTGGDLFSELGRPASPGR